MKNVLIFILTLTFFSVNINSQSKVQAEMGVLYKSDGKFRNAVGEQVAFSGDAARVFLKASTNLKSYIVAIDDREATLLDSRSLSVSNALLMPSGDSYYTFDGKSKRETFALICATDKVQEIESLFQGKSSVPASSWSAVEQQLINLTRGNNIGSSNSSTTSMQGNTRSIGWTSITNSEFQNTLISFSDAKIVMKIFSFKVK